MALRLRRLTQLIWIVLILQAGFLTASLLSLPWAQWLPGWYLPLMMVLAQGTGALLVRSVSLVSHRQPSWDHIIRPTFTVVALSLSVGVLSALGAMFLLAWHPPRTVVSTLPAVIIAASAPFLVALAPWATLQVRRPIVILVPMWIGVLGIQHSQPVPLSLRIPLSATVSLTLQNDWWLTLFFLLSMALLNLTTLYQRVVRWKQQGLLERGPVFERLIRGSLALLVVASCIAVLPLGIPATHWLDRFLNRSGQNGTFQYPDPQGVPLSYLGAPLDVGAPPAASESIVLYYQVLAGATNDALPPLTGAAFTTFQDSTWEQGPTVSTSVPVISPGVQASLNIYSARYTFAQPPRTPYVLLIGQPLSVSLPATAQRLDQFATDPLGVVGWQVATPIQTGTTYTALSAVVATPQVDLGAIPSPLLAQLRAVPASEQAAIATLMTQLAIPAGSLVDQATALVQRLRAVITIDPLARPTGDPIHWALVNHRANENLFNTVYVLAGRSLGLPLRFVEGYAPGERFTDTDGVQRYRVRERDGLTWAQLALGAQGWYDLFPAGKERAIVGRANGAPSRTPTPLVTPTPTVSPSNTPSSLAGSAWSWIIGVFAIMVVSILVVLFLLAWWRWWLLGRGRPAMMRMATRLAYLSHLVGVDVQPSDTATMVVHKEAQVLPQYADDLTALAPLYNQAVYDPSGNPDTWHSWSAWPVLRRALLRLIVLTPHLWRFRRPRSIR